MKVRVMLPPNHLVRANLPRTAVGCFLGAMATAFVGEKAGRRKSIAAGAVIMIVGAILQTTAYSRAHMIVARIVSGFGMGAINSTAPVLLAEFAPKTSRGLCKSDRGILGNVWPD